MVSVLQRHQPDRAQFLTGLLSPLLTHCKMLRQAMGEEIGTVFIGPCIAKKGEAAAEPLEHEVDAVLTFVPTTAMPAPPSPKPTRRMTCDGQVHD